MTSEPTPVCCHQPGCPSRLALATEQAKVARLREALNDCASLMPLDRWMLLKPETQATMAAFDKGWARRRRRPLAKTAEAAE